MHNRGAFNWFAPLAIVLGLGGCSVNKRYAPPELNLPAAQKHLFAAVRRHVQNTSWQTVTANPNAGYLEAVTPARRVGGVPTRERWRFYVAADRIRVRRHFEASFADASRPDHPKRWEHTDNVVCGGYAYKREREVLRQLAALTLESWVRAQSQRPVALQQ